jgi:hypothetical protein
MVRTKIEAKGVLVGETYLISDAFVDKKATGLCDNASFQQVCSIYFGNYVGE